MKKKGSKSDFTEERDKELRAAFFSQDAYSTTDRALTKLVRKPSSRFWVDPERARDVLSRIEKRPELLDDMLPERQRMYLALLSKYEEMKKKYPKESKVSCVAMAIYSGAPEFFITASTARSIIYK